jgi:hypothetical protein
VTLIFTIELALLVTQRPTHVLACIVGQQLSQPLQYTTLSCALKTVASDWAAIAPNHSYAPLSDSNACH